MDDALSGRYASEDDAFGAWNTYHVFGTALAITYDLLA